MSNIFYVCFRIFLSYIYQYVSRQEGGEVFVLDACVLVFAEQVVQANGDRVDDEEETFPHDMHHRCSPICNKDFFWSSAYGLRHNLSSNQHNDSAEYNCQPVRHKCMYNQRKRLKCNCIIDQESDEPEVMVANDLLNGPSHLFLFRVPAHSHHFELQLVDIAETNGHSRAEGSRRC